MHKKHLSLMTLLLAFLFSGCGETNDEIRKKDKIIILHEVNNAGCFFLEGYKKSKLHLDDQVKNVVFSSKKNDATCAGYNKTKGEIVDYKTIDASTSVECAEIPFSELEASFPKKELAIYRNKNRSCVLSFDIK